MNTSNKRLKIGASFPGFYLTFLTPRLAKALPSDTLSNSGQSLPANTCLFHPTDGESHPSRLRASISSQVTASASRPPQLYLSIFTCPTASLNRPSDAGESLPDRQLYLFEPVAQRGSPVRHGNLETSRTSTRANRSVKLIFSILRPAKAYPTTLPVDCKAFRPLNFTLPSNPVQLGEPRSLPTDAGESTPGQTIFSFQVHARRGLPVRQDDPETTVGREPPS